MKYAIKKTYSGTYILIGLSKKKKRQGWFKPTIEVESWDRINFMGSVGCLIPGGISNSIDIPTSPEFKTAKAAEIWIRELEKNSKVGIVKEFEL